jgi:hypothetical protein
VGGRRGSRIGDSVVLGEVEIISRFKYSTGQELVKGKENSQNRQVNDRIKLFEERKIKFFLYIVLNVYSGKYKHRR